MALHRLEVFEDKRHVNSKPYEQTSEGRTRTGSNSSLGEQLRQTRTARNISLREISEQTRISMRHLEAIEADDYKQLPGGIFNRSFIKSYAKHIGFDEAVALEAYTRTAREHGAQPDETVTKLHQPLVYTDTTSSRSPVVTVLLSVVILGILTLGVIAGLHWYRRQTTPQAAPVSDPKLQTQNPPATSANPAQPTANTTAPVKLNVQVKARGENVWIRTKTDEAASTDTILSSNKSQDFAPVHRLSLQYDKRKAGALEVTINGRPAKVPVDSTGRLAEMVITGEGYSQLLQ